MKKQSGFSVLLLGCFIILFFSFKKATDPEYDPLNNQIIQQWEVVTDSMLANTKIPGMIIGIWAPDRNLAWVVGKGKAITATCVKPDPSMKFRMGSLTKTYTYTVLLQLVEEGHLSLAYKLSKFIPDFPKADSITIRMFCNHTSGIFDYTSTVPFMNSLMGNPLKKWTNTEIIDLVRTEPFYFSPGNSFEYSNTNTIITGEIVEQLTGNTIESESQHRLIDRFNLLNTIYPTDQTITGTFVHGYGWGNEDSTDVSQAYDPSMAGASGAMVADVYDLKTWVEQLYKGSLLKPATQVQRLTVVPAPGEDCEEYGLGIMHKINPNMWGHTGTIPWYKNWAGYCPSINATIVISYNSTLSKPMVLASRLMQIYLDSVN